MLVTGVRKKIIRDKLIRLNDEITKRIKELEECVKEKDPKECIADAIRFLALSTGY